MGERGIRANRKLSPVDVVYWRLNASVVLQTKSLKAFFEADWSYGC